MSLILDHSAEREARIEELSQLVGAFSDISDKLQQSHAALTERVASLQAELAAKNRLLERQQELLSDKQKQLERKNRLAALGEMAAGLAHEIRNPLGGIGLYAGLLADDLGDRAELLQLVERIQNGTRRMERTVSQVLRFAGEVVAEPRRVNVAEVARETVDLARAEGQRRGVVLELKAPAVLEANVDPDLLGQALLNLVLNALDVARRVNVEVTRRMEESQSVEIRVADDGLGLPPDVDAERLFDPFFTTKDTGTGLGLSIVHRIAEAHGGGVRAENTGQGARFVLWL